MRYLGIDVHSLTSSWCLLDDSGSVRARGRVSTSEDGFSQLLNEIGGSEDLLAGQEVGSFAYFVRDTFHAQGVELLSFNANHLRMIASSRKKSDRRDAFWIAKSLQTGMMPHPVYLPSGEIQSLRVTLARRAVIKRDRNRWILRVRGALKSIGVRLAPGVNGVLRLLPEPQWPEPIRETVALCQRQARALGHELRRLEVDLRVALKGDDTTERLQSIPGIGWLTAATIVAWVGDISRFPTARHLAAYAGLVPSVRQSGTTNHLGHITKEGAPALRSALVQGAHSVMTSRSSRAKPLRDIFDQVRRERGRYKIATVALARHLLRIAFYVLRDSTVYEPSRIRSRA